MIVHVNGESRDLSDKTTVDVLVQVLAGRREGLAVAINEELVPRSAWSTTRLRGGDRIEVLTAAQGG